MTWILWDRLTFKIDKNISSSNNVLISKEIRNTYKNECSYIPVSRTLMLTVNASMLWQKRFWPCTRLQLVVCLKNVRVKIRPFLRYLSYRRQNRMETLLKNCLTCWTAIMPESRYLCFKFLTVHGYTDYIIILYGASQKPYRSVASQFNFFWSSIHFIVNDFSSSDHTQTKRQFKCTYNTA